MSGTATGDGGAPEKPGGAGAEPYGMEAGTAPHGAGTGTGVEPYGSGADLRRTGTGTGKGPGKGPGTGASTERSEVDAYADASTGDADTDASAGLPASAPTGAARLGNVLARAAAVTACLTVAGALLGLVRDQTIARLYGASTDSDAFLIAWTVPEMAATLLIEDAMALLLVPAFSHAVARRATAGEAVRELVAATFPRLFTVLACATGLLIVFAPWFVGLIAPGFADPGLAVDCTRLTALAVLTYGIAGYFSAALRAHGHFLSPAGVYVASNVGIIATTLVLHSLWGVRAAAAGVAVGGLLMVLSQLPTFVRQVLRARPTVRRLPRQRNRTDLLGFAVLAPIVLFAVSRQSQVLVERFLASALPGGAISHLNYAQKVAQMPMVLSLMFCTVTFPVVAKAMADGDRERARRRVENDLALAGMVVLVGTALIVGHAPQLIEVLFERGAFDAQDTETTATVMRVYAVGLLGHTLVGALGRPFFSAGRPTWYPAAAMAVGLVVTIVVGAVAVRPWGVYGIAGANAIGISATAVLLLGGLGPRVVPIEVPAISRAIGRLAVAAMAAAAAGRVTAPLIADPMLSLAVGCLLVPAVFITTGLAVRAPEVLHLLSLTRQRIRHVR
ncbi:murein biosynthesis integral membrane protein MurJ [Streptomyces sp. NPDC020965]|uniref:murein biosynthesis integral membrane protein MurJ n=1 Tax=Streptomyces sp. NPDC020965 TaxID=3365105 RepID=UPI0037B713F1